MKQTTSPIQMPTYETSGDELTIYWDEQTEQRVGVERDSQTVYTYAYCVVSVHADRATIIEQIMSCMYPTYGSELAAIINGGADAEAHEAARVQAKALADGWLSN
jgi:hypothetical protein